jgi:hypothetical protein
MPRNVHHRYFLDLKIKSTNKAELIEELETLLEHVKKPNTFGMAFFGDSGTCFVDGDLTTPVPHNTRP